MARTRVPPSNPPQGGGGSAVFRRYAVAPPNLARGAVSSVRNPPNACTPKPIFPCLRASFGPLCIRGFFVNCQM